MRQTYLPPSPGCYRLRRDVRLELRDDGTLAICAFPLRIVRLPALAAQVLALCTEARTCAQLAAKLKQPLPRITALCDQLRWKGLLEAGPALPPAIWPVISIVIPSHNRAPQLERCLLSLLALVYPRPDALEIIVIDDASSDETPTMLPKMQQRAAQQGIHLQHLRHTQQRGVAFSRNAGVSLACHEFVAFIDSDCVASPTWLTDLVPAFQDARVAAVGGMIRAHDRQSPLGRYEDVCSSLYMGQSPQQLRLVGPYTYLPMANLLVRRSCWLQLGGLYPFSFGEDVDFCLRLLEAGYQIHYLPQGLVYHDYRTSLPSFLHTRLDYASSEAHLQQRHPSSRRVLLLPPEQASFAALSLAGISGLLSVLLPSLTHRRGRSFTKTASPSLLLSFCSLLAPLLLTLGGSLQRQRKAHQQRIHLHPFTIFWATLRSHLSYTYHLCRHLTRYYTLPLLLLSLCLPPLLIPTCLLCATVRIVDYIRLRPRLSFALFSCYALLEDCAYEIGVVKGCLARKTWQPLVPLIKKRP